MNFDEWWDSEGIQRGDWNARGSAYETAKLGWMAALKSLEEEQDMEPTTTEMVKGLLEKGWEFSQISDGYMMVLKEPGGNTRFQTSGIREAYLRAFPPKKKVEVEVWGTRIGKEWKVCSRNIPFLPENLIAAGWVKGTATFWVKGE